MIRMMVSCALALALLLSFYVEASAQTTCSGWNSKCLQRCKQSGAASCPYCTGQLSNCKTSGCWTEHPRFGGATRCNLKK